MMNLSSPNVPAPPTMTTETSKISGKNYFLQLRDTLKKKKSKISHMTVQMGKYESTICELKTQINNLKMCNKMKDLEIENLKSRLVSTSSNRQSDSGINRVMAM